MVLDSTTLPAGLERSFPVWGGPAERLRFLLAWAVLAPSRHNAQPWLFEIEGDELRIIADATRALPAVDPDGRELAMGCGAAIVNLRVAAAHFGHATSEEVVREHRRDGLVARVRLEERRASSPENEELFQAIPRRRTNRLPLDGREPPTGLVTQLLREARREGVSLRLVEEQQRRPVAELVAEGARRLWGSPRFRSEYATWSRLNRTGRADGMPGWASGRSDAAALLQPLLLRFTNPARVEAERERWRALGTRALLVLSTARDGKAEWVAAGEALERVLLRATAAGLSASYLNEPIEVPELRARLRDLLGEPGVPQLMLRLGHGLVVRPTPRRPVEEVLRRIDVRYRRPALLARYDPSLALPRPPPPRPGAGAGAPGTLH
ncbi:Acg family FMN-binding oxidoreductase [Anaeromyxobacter oryzisoli]|uniref:Acg family FMN-binding oxidoreductase n=1 Tax=Anaeromyxobacter oryzisoli TaxID=2925408 RepID=UPI001F597D2D|nr:nitroreductase family protein [Anaeromyxobacter sp. SG63]